MKENIIGKKITIHYTLQLKNGDVIESTRNSDPVHITLGNGTMLRRLEEEIATMKSGERKTIEIASGEAFGNYKKDLVMSLPANKFPEGVEMGKKYILLVNDSKTIAVLVTEIKGDKITVDGNHPLAGKDLIFDVEMLEVA